MPDTDVTRDLFLHWFQHAYGHELQLTDFAGPTLIANIGEMRLALEVQPLPAPAPNEPWDSVRIDLESRISEAVPGAIAVWTPLGASLPIDEPGSSEFIEEIAKTAIKLGPRERSHAPLPIELYLRKNEESGGVISVTGGLNAHWAKFTQHVTGAYDLDSTSLHRLPESEEHLNELIEAIITLSKTLDVGQVGSLPTIDAWTVQRTDDEGSAKIVGVPPSVADDAGRQMRPNLRRAIAASAPRLREAEADVRAIVLLAYYGRVEDEVVTTALRGFDPALYSGLDIVCLVVDGIVKPLIQAPIEALAVRR